MNIKEVAARAGLPPKTIRYYEEIGLIRPKRAANGYRSFAAADAAQAHALMESNQHTGKIVLTW